MIEAKQYVLSFSREDVKFSQIYPVPIAWKYLTFYLRLDECASCFSERWNIKLNECTEISKWDIVYIGTCIYRKHCYFYICLTFLIETIIIKKNVLTSPVTWNQKNWNWIFHEIIQVTEIYLRLSPLKEKKSESHILQVKLQI